ncbi:dienelactone hydrolase family protein [Maricaulis parjimensis]|uniref:dienelactone hydrolase family protein n=1 Tax=Maricaulis parjimensis TaxID=144023 RepID=UPI00193945FF|nr:dienelactone hydrolase family protein [Maricaulis parjimensis]
MHLALTVAGLARHGRVMSLVRRILVPVSVILLIVLSGLGACAVGNATGLSVPRRSLAEQSALLDRHVEMRLPETANGPVPALILLHGCGGLREVQNAYSDRVLQAGYAAVIVDSNGARGIGRFGAMSRVCTAQTLWGQDRAADIAAVLDQLRDTPGIDGDRLALIGWSHGGWSLMEALAYSGSGDQPRALSDQNLSLTPQVRLAIAMYPYCGFPMRTSGADFDPDIPLRAILAEQDVIAPHAACIRRFDRAAAAGVDLEFSVWDGQSHAFDEPNPPPDPRIRYDAEAARRAQDQVVDWLDETFADQG